MYVYPVWSSVVHPSFEAWLESARERSKREGKKGAAEILEEYINLKKDDLRRYADPMYFFPNHAEYRVTSYCMLAQAFIDKYANEARDLIWNTKWEEGKALGKIWAERTMKRGKSIDILSMIECMYESWPWPSQLWWWPVREKNHAVMRMMCWVGETVRKIGVHEPERNYPPIGEKAGRLYCDVDWPIETDGFSKKIKLTRNYWVPLDGFCEYEWKME